MPIKRIHILANSVKKSQHCIAGRELIEHNGKLVFGDWIRPVSRHGEGELSWTDCRFPNGKTPKIFDVVDMELEEHEGSASQPENWFINTDKQWKKVDIEEDQLPELVVDTPQRLWQEPGGRGDRISIDALKALKCGRSLYLIQVSRLRLQLGWRSYQNKQSRRRRALFEYRGQDYDFSLTDPRMDKYTSPFPKPEDGTKTIKVDSGGECLLCVSLTPPFQGYHYKIVATVIEQGS
jgi:hypothetical protein